MWLVFEFIIYFFLISVGAFLIEVLTQWKTFKKKRIVATIAVFLVLGWVTVFYGSFIEPRRLIVNDVNVSVSDDPENELHAVVVADFHVGPYKKADWVKKVVQEINTQKPDIILIPGDFIFKDPSEMKYLGALSQLSAPLGVYAVTGNHDYQKNGSEIVIKSLREMGIKVIQNDSVVIEGRRKLILAGISDIWFEGNPYKTLASFKDEDSVILLSHNPDVMLFSESERADLVVSGHTHCGQIRLPFFGSLVRVPTELGNDFDRGLFDYNGTDLFITCGVGETGPRARLFNPPEIVNLNISY